MARPKPKRTRKYQNRARLGERKKVIISANSLYRLDEAAKIAGVKTEQMMQIIKEMMQHGVTEQEIFQTGKLRGTAFRKIADEIRKRKK